jgi:hypothetical protein
VKPPAREALTVFWDGEEVPGFIVFALGAPGVKRPEDLPTFGWTIEPDVRSSTLAGNQWIVAVWYIRVVGWPTPGEFRDSMRRVLCGLVGDGYTAAWIGIEGSFVDPPDLFTAEAMPESVLAACSAETGYLVAVDLDLPLQALPDNDLAALREASGDLAGAE